MRRMKTLKKLKVYYFKGFKIVMFRNHLKSHPFEFKLVPITQVALNKARVHGRLRKVIHDSTSMTYRNESYVDAKACIKGIKPPFYY